jgi:hypothetical protein
MQPMGRKPVRFPRKEDCHPPKGHVNWWEAEIETANKAAERDKAKKEIAQALADEVPNK